MTARRTLAVAAALYSLAVSAVGADEPARFEPWIAGAATLTSPSGSVTSAYTPVLGGGGVQRSGSAGQTLAMDAARGPGVEAGLAFFPSAHLGVQVMGSYSRSDVGGLNGPYEVHLAYTSIQPPSPEPQEFSFDDARPWPDTVGRLRRVGLAADAVARFGTGRWQGRVFAGLAYVRLSGEAESLAYSAFRLGGHSVLFVDEPHVALALDGASGIALHLGAQAELRLGPRVAALVGVRYLGGSDLELPVRLTRIVNPDEVVNTQPLADIDAALHVAPARLSPQAVQVVLGLTLRR